MRKNDDSPAKRLTPAQILGASPVELDTRPNIIISRIASVIATAISDNLPLGALYRYHGDYITISLQTISTPEGDSYPEIERRIMTPTRFTTWLEQFMTFSAKNDSPPESISKHLAEKILASDYFRSRIPEITEIVPVRLPAWRVNAGGKRGLRILPAGYDPETGIYSAETVKWDPSTVYEVGAVVRALQAILQSFPWGERAASICGSRSASCFVAYMVGQFCRHLISRQPMVLLNGNQQGTGKTLLAQMGLGPVHGYVSINSYPADEASLQKMLFTKLVSGAQYVLLDDLKSLSSTTINQYATSDRISDRLLGSNNEFSGMNRMQMIATGNNLPTTPDVERRSLIIDLFDEEKSVDKNIKKPLKAKVFSNAQWRADMLTALWSIVKAWDIEGCPQKCPESSMPSFESFAETVGSIVIHAGFISPFTRRIVTTEGGDVRGSTLERLIISLADSIQPGEFESEHTGLSQHFSVPEILDIANEMAIADIICSGKNANQSLGHQLRKLKGRQYKDSRGRKFTFGRREDAISSKYNVVILSEPTK